MTAPRQMVDPDLLSMFSGNLPQPEANYALSHNTANRLTQTAVDLSPPEHLKYFVDDPALAAVRSALFSAGSKFLMLGSTLAKVPANRDAISAAMIELSGTIALLQNHREQAHVKQAMAACGAGWLALSAL